MGRKRKAEMGVATAKQDKSSNARLDTKTVKEKIHSHTDNSNATEAMTIDNEVHSDFNGLPSKKRRSQVTSVVLKRSGRLINSVLPTGRKQMKPVVEHIGLVGSERKEVPPVQQANTLPVLNEKTMEEKVPQVPKVGTVSVVNDGNLEENAEYLVHAFGEFMSKTVKQVSKPPNEGPATYFSYKGLYIDSQKKIDDLMEENYQLVKKLEFALGKIEAYEKMKDAMCASKEVILLSSLEKSIEAKVNSSSHQKCISPTVAATDTPGDHKTNKTSPPKQKKGNYKKKKAKS